MLSEISIYKKLKLLPLVQRVSTFTGEIIFYSIFLPLSLGPFIELPWSDIEPLALKRWLWLPLSSDNVTILNKDWLWGEWSFYYHWQLSLYCS